MLEKFRCPERNLNPRHPDLRKGALTTELPSNHSGVSQILATKETSITRHLLPGLSDWESLLLVVEAPAHRTRCYRPYKLHCGCRSSSVIRAPLMRSGCRGFESRSEHLIFPAFFLYLEGISELTSLMMNIWFKICRVMYM